MSTVGVDDIILKCAACARGGEGLKTCTACKRVNYCNVACQKAHRAKHKKECKKWAEEMAAANFAAASARIDRIVVTDDELFRDPPPKEECPICFVPMPFSVGFSAVPKVYQLCCGKYICGGCVGACSIEWSNENAARDRGNIPRLPMMSCPFCREPMDDQNLKRCKKRMDANDARAFHMIGAQYDRGGWGLPRDPKKAVESWIRSAELGSVEAHLTLGIAYLNGEGGLAINNEKAIHHFKIAAIGGHEKARHNLGVLEKTDRNRRAKHLMIAASAGYDKSLEQCLKDRILTNDEYRKTQDAFESSQAEMESDHRTSYSSSFA